MKYLLLILAVSLGAVAGEKEDRAECGRLTQIWLQRKALNLTFAERSAIWEQLQALRNKLSARPKPARVYTGW